MSKRILVIEDEEDNRRIMRDLLTSVGYEIIEALVARVKSMLRIKALHDTV
jgi:CheY-like chemotaxis protein